jgi:hypothetical protein
MSSNSNTFRISNEQLLLIDILNTMYNLNLRQINNITDTLNNLYDANNQIRNLLIQLLNSNQYSGSNQRRNGFAERRNRENNNNPDRDRNNNRNDNRNNNRNNNRNDNRNNNRNNNRNDNRPYIVDSVAEYTIPRQILQNYSNQNQNNTNLDSFAQLFQNFLQPVEIYPTQSQIEAATRGVRYCDITRPINTQCPISMDEFNDNDMVTVIRHCGHTFHTEHLMSWLRSNCRCPVCRYDIREYNSNASTDFFNNSTQNIQSHNTSSSTTVQQPSTTLFDSSNNILERNNITRRDIINRNVSNSGFNLFNDTNINNLTETIDLSGNQIDTLTGLGGTTALLYLLNTMNNINRNSR